MIITGKDLKKAIKIADLTQMEAANKLGIVRQTLVNWFEIGELSPEIVQNVHDKLNINLVADRSNNLSEPEVDYKITEVKDIRVPIYNTELSSGIMAKLIEGNESGFNVGYLTIPEVSGCDAIIRARGQSMAPRINDGDWLGVKRVDDWKDWLPMDYIYAIETDSLQLVKYIKKGPSPDAFTIASENKEFKDDEIPKKVIKEIWLVKTILPFSKVETII